MLTNSTAQSIQLALSPGHCEVKDLCHLGKAGVPARRCFYVILIIFTLLHPLPFAFLKI